MKVWNCTVTVIFSDVTESLLGVTEGRPEVSEDGLGSGNGSGFLILILLNVHLNDALLNNNINK